MALFGVYPFTLYITNMFGPDTGVSVELKVYSHRSYYDDESKRFVVEPVKPGEDPVKYSIPYGGSLAVPMYFGDSYAQISLRGLPKTTYYVASGGKARNYPLNGLEKAEVTETVLGTGTDDDAETFYLGGVWEIDPSNTDTDNWKLQVKKYSMDPEDDNVVIGPINPG